MQQVYGELCVEHTDNIIPTHMNYVVAYYITRSWQSCVLGLFYCREFGRPQGPTLHSPGSQEAGIQCPASFCACPIVRFIGTCHQVMIHVFRGLRLVLYTGQAHPATTMIHTYSGGTSLA